MNKFIQKVVHPRAAHSYLEADGISLAYFE